MKAPFLRCLYQMSCPQPRYALLFIWGSSPSLHNIFVQMCILNHYKLCVLPSAGKAISYHAFCFFFFFAFCFLPGLPVIRKANISICNIIVYYSWDNFQVHLSFVVLQYIHSWTLRAYHKSVSLSSLFIVFSFDSSQYFASVLIST